MTRVFGTLQPLNPNLYAGFLLPALSAAAACFAFFGLRYAGIKRLAGLLLAGILVGLILFGVVMSGSRGGYLGLAGASLAMFLLVGHWLWYASGSALASARKLWLASGVGAIMASALAISLMPSLQARVLSIGALWQDSSIAYRLQVYQTAWRMIQDNVWLGIGPGNETFRQIFGAYAPAHLHALGAYSIPLEMLVELGVLGAGTAVAVLIVLFLRLFSALERSQANSPDASMDRVLIIGGGVAIVACLANGLFDTVWYRPAVQIPFWMWVALLNHASTRALQAPVD